VLSQSVVCLIRLSGKAISAYAAEVVGFVMAMALDPFHEVALQACAAVVELNGKHLHVCVLRVCMHTGICYGWLGFSCLLDVRSLLDHLHLLPPRAFAVVMETHEKSNCVK